MSELLARPVRRNNHLRKPHDKKSTPAKQHGFWREKIKAQGRGQSYVLQVVAVDLIFFDIYLGVFWHHFEFRLTIFEISRNYFGISENLKNRTGLDFERSQWMKKHKIGATRVHDVVIFIPGHSGHGTVTQSTCGQMCVSYGKIERSIEIAMAKKCISNSTEPVIPECLIR